MKKMVLSGIMFAALALLIAACGAAAELEPADTNGGGLTQNADGYTDVSVEQLAEMMTAKDFTLVNVHVPYQGEIPQTDQFIPFDQVADNLDKLPAKDAPIVLYCRSGSMSTTAAKTLVGLSYTNVLEVDGGFNAWKAAGYELLDKSP